MRPRILIVEDEPILALDLKETLQDAGYAIVGICHSAEDAIEVCRDLHPQLVLMDIKLEGILDGTEAASLIQQELEIPVVFLTSYLDDETLEAAYKASPYGYLQKPYRTETLTMTVKLALDQYAKEQRLVMNLRSLQHQQAILSPQTVQLSHSTSYQLFSGSVLQSGTAISLTANEKKFLDLLASNVDITISFKEIYQKIWNCDTDKIQPLRTLLHRLRLKSGGGLAIESVHEVGYRLNATVPNQ